jgi:hypothetical protein
MIWELSHCRYFVGVGGCTLATMIHATESTLLHYDTFLSALRDIDGLVERRPGIFYRKSKAFLHFHEDPLGLYADLRTEADGDFTRWHVESKKQQTALLAAVKTALATTVRPSKPIIRS